MNLLTSSTLRATTLICSPNWPPDLRAHGVMRASGSVCSKM
jgi:hypothetical protein